MAWSDYLNEKAYREFFEKPRFERATEPPREEKESWLTKAFETFRTGRELAERAMVEPEIPIVEREKPGPREELTREYRGIVERLQKGEISDEHAEYLWNTAPETVFGNVSAIGLGAGPRLRDIRSFSDIKALGLEAITPVAPPEMTEPLGRVPVVGRALEHEAAALTSPLGLAFTAKFPGITAMMAAGGVTGATAGRRIAGERGEMVGGLAGALAAPIAGPTAARVALRGAKAAPAAGRTALAEAERLIPRARQIISEEAGGLKPKKVPLNRFPKDIREEIPGFIKNEESLAGRALTNEELARRLTGRPFFQTTRLRQLETQYGMTREGLGRELIERMPPAKPPAPIGAARPKMVLTNDIRTPMEINKRLNQLAKLERLTAKQKAERIRLYAEKDLNELRAAGTVDDQMDSLLDDISQMEQELELRAVSREYKPAQAPQFGTAERAEWTAARAGRPHGVRPETRFSGEPGDVLEGRLKVYKEFADNMKIEPVKPGEEHLVSRARFTERGEVVKEPTFATEGELAGVRPQQAELGIGAGERPIETAGPMFERAAPEVARAIDPRGDLALRKALAEELFAARGTPQTGPYSKSLRVLHYADDRPKLEKIARRFGYEVEITDLPDVTYIKAPGMGRITPEVAAAPKPVARPSAAEIDRRLGAMEGEIRAAGETAAPARRAAQEAADARELEGILGDLMPKRKPPTPKPAAQAFREATEVRRPGVPTREEAIGRWRAGYEKPAAAPEAARAGIEPPREPPTRPPTAEAVPPVPPEDPVGKLTQLIRAAKPVRAETEAMKHTVRQRQAAQLRDIWAKHPGPEGLRRAKGALKGELPTAKFEPPRLKMTTDDIYELHARAARADIQEFQKLNLKEALEKVLAGEQPTWGEISRLESVFGRELGKALESQMPLGKRAWREFWELTGLPRAVQTAFDMSFHLRQGILLTPRHLKEAGQAFKQAARALKETNAKGRVAYWEQMKTAGEIPDNTFIAKFGEAAAFQERAEPFITRWADRIPGIRISERVFATGGNEMRGQLARTLKQTWEKGLGRSLTSEEGKWVGRLVNYGTGRGPLPDNLRQVLGGIFYAPGFRSSKPAYVSLLLNPQTPAFVRGMVAQELVTFVGAGVATLTVLDVSGLAEVELDPRSSDWGKIRIGEMRMDFWGGNQQIARSIAQLITGQRKTLSTGDIMGLERRDVPTRYLEGGLSPQASIGLDVFRGETFMGEQLKPEMETARGQFWNRMAPMGIQDIVEAVKTEKAIGAIAAPFAFLGVGVYAPDLAGAKVNELCRQYDPEGRRKQEMTSVEFQRLADEHPDLAAAYEKQISQASERGSEWAEFKEAQDEADAQIESDLMAALADPQGRTWQDISDGLGDYFRERAIRNNVQYGDLELDPRGELGRKIDAYYAVELPRFATEEQRTAFFNERGAMLEADPELAAAILDNQVLRFSDSDVRRFIRLRWEAQQIADEYYSIPYKSRMPAEQQEQVSFYVSQAEDIARMQGVPFRRALIQTDIPPELIGLAMRYKRLPTNKARARYWRQHPENEELYKTFYGDIPLDIPLEMEPEMAMAGVP